MYNHHDLIYVSCLNIYDIRTNAHDNSNTKHVTSNINNTERLK